MAHVHISKLDQVHCRSELIARALVCKKSIYIGDMVLKYDGVLRAFKLKPDHVPVSLEGIVDVIQNATCEDYLRAGHRIKTHFHIEEIFAGQNLYEDFDEVELGASSWQPKLDAIQEQIDALDSTYAQDAEVVAAFASQIAETGDIFALVAAQVAVETTRALGKEAEIQADVDTNQTTLVSAVDAEASTRLSADTALTLSVSDEVAARELVVEQLNDEVIVYCDANRGDSYTEDGSRRKPYKSLVSALTAKITDSGTSTLVFKLAPGYYTGIYAFTKTSQNQSISILGSSAQDTFIQGASVWTDDTIGNVLFFKNFNEVTVKNLTIQLGDYGFYPRGCKRVECDNVRFRWLGASSDAGNFDFAKTQAERQSMWSLKVTLSNGGACRIRACDSVFVKNCEVYETLRGLRIQDCGGGVISNCRTDKTLESGIYLAAGSYTGTDGCSRFLVTGNQVVHALNNGLLCIGGKKNTFSGNCVIGCASAGFQSWSSVTCNVNSNTFYNCNRLSYNGVGNSGDAQGCIVCDGNSSTQEGTYAIAVSGNSMLKCNAGGNAQVIGVNVRAGAYPSESNRCHVSGNITDASIRVQSANIPLLDPLTVSGSVVNLANLPTEGTGLAVGDLWNNVGILNVKQ